MKTIKRILRLAAPVGLLALCAAGCATTGNQGELSALEPRQYFSVREINPYAAAEW